MTCLNPYVVSIGLAFGCGRCFFCRRKKAKEWTHRIILEAAEHKDNAFVTLTYDDDHLPEGGTLVPRHLQLFLKKLRKSVEPARLRFFGVGEYGDRTRRPHYHVALFGYPPCSSLTVRSGSPCRCPSCVGVTRAWSDENGSLGFVSVGRLEPASAGYVAAYATKSMEKDDADVITPEGCVPPFSRQSNRPGIGAGVADDIASALLQHGATDISNVPLHLSHGNKSRRPLGRYLRNRICERIGVPKDERTAFGLKALEKKMQPLREIALKASAGTRTITFREELVKADDNRRLQIMKKHAIFKQRKKL